MSNISSWAIKDSSVYRDTGGGLGEEVMTEVLRETEKGEHYTLCINSTQILDWSLTKLVGRPPIPCRKPNNNKAFSVCALNGRQLEGSGQLSAHRNKIQSSGDCQDQGAPQTYTTTFAGDCHRIKGLYQHVLWYLLDAQHGAGDMAQCLREYSALAEDPRPVSSNHIGYLIVACSSSSRAPFGLTDTFTHMHKPIQTHN